MHLSLCCSLACNRLLFCTSDPHMNSDGEGGVGELEGGGIEEENEEKALQNNKR